MKTRKRVRQNRERKNLDRKAGKRAKRDSAEPRKRARSEQRVRERANVGLATLTLSREQVAAALNIHTDSLDALHKQNLGPPRYHCTPRRYAYPVEEFRRWQEQRLQAETTRPARDFSRLLEEIATADD